MLSNDSSTSTISPISQSRDVTPAAIAGDPQRLMDANEIVVHRKPRHGRRVVSLAERFDRFDHARSAEEIPMTLKGLDKTWGWIWCSANCREEGVAIRA